MTTPSPCAPPNSSDQCYSVQGDLTINGVSFTLAANGMFDPNTCRTRRTKTCCQNVLTGQFQNPDGNVNFSSAGRACGSGNTETVKGPMQLEGADGGAFQGQKGSGVLQATIDTNTEQGTAKVSGAIHK